VSFRTPDGGWSDAVNLGGGVNSEQSENRPFITADGKYLFYNRGNSENRDVYWVDLGVVRKLKPAKWQAGAIHLEQILVKVTPLTSIASQSWSR